MFVVPLFEVFEVREADPEDDWDYGEREGSLNGAAISKFHDYNGVETNLKPPFYAVVVGYKTGNTFGTDYDAVVIDVVKTQEEAVELALACEHCNEGYSMTHEGKEYRVPWNGYFEKREQVAICEVKDRGGLDTLDSNIVWL